MVHTFFFKLEFLITMLDYGMLSPETFIKLCKYRRKYYLESGGLSQICENTDPGLRRYLVTLIHPQRVFISLQQTGVDFSVEEIEAMAKQFMRARQKCANRMEYLNLETDFQHRAVTIRKS